MVTLLPRTGMLQGFIALLSVLSLLFIVAASWLYLPRTLITNPAFLHAELGNNPYVDQLRVALCVIASNEEAYIGEFIQYYIDFGINHIFIYDNSKNATNLQDALGLYNDDVLTVIPYPGKNVQMKSYKDCSFHHGDGFDWMGFLDVDEFIVTREHTSVQALLATVDEDLWFGAACINWRTFGDSNLTEYDDRCVTHRFMYRRDDIDMHVKCFGRPLAIDRFITPHNPVLLPGYKQYSLSFDTPFNDSGPWFPPIASIDPDVVIHHYYTKTKPEYEKKVARGRADIPQSREDEAFEYVNQGANAVHDDTAWTQWMKRRQAGGSISIPCT